MIRRGRGSRALAGPRNKRGRARKARNRQDPQQTRHRAARPSLAIAGDRGAFRNRPASGSRHRGFRRLLSPSRRIAPCYRFGAVECTAGPQRRTSALPRKEWPVLARFELAQTAPRTEPGVRNLCCFHAPPTRTAAPTTSSRDSHFGSAETQSRTLGPHCRGGDTAAAACNRS